MGETGLTFEINLSKKAVLLHWKMLRPGGFKPRGPKLFCSIRRKNRRSKIRFIPIVCSALTGKVSAATDD